MPAPMRISPTPDISTDGPPARSSLLKFGLPVAVVLVVLVLVLTVGHGATPAPIPTALPATVMTQPAATPPSMATVAPTSPPAPTATLAPPPTTVVQIVQVPPAVASTPACRPGSSFLDVITKQEVAAQWGTAATNARTALQAPDLCPQDRAVLAQKAVNDGLEALFAEPFAPNDTAAAQRSLDSYRDLRAFAGQSGVTLPSSRQVAGRAYDGGKFRLAQQAWEDALAAGEVTTTDREQVRFYDAALFNIGKWYTDDRSNTARFDEGVRYLVTADRIDRQFGLGSGAAGGRLRELFGPDEQAWPGDDVRSPLITSSR